MDALSLLPGAGLDASAASSRAPRADEAKIREAANQFEALLVAQMLKSARESSAQDSEGSGDQAGSSLMEMGEQSIAQVLSSNGGLGLAAMIMKQLRPETKDLGIPADKLQRREEKVHR